MDEIKKNQTKSLLVDIHRVSVLCTIQQSNIEWQSFSYVTINHGKSFVLYGKVKSTPYNNNNKKIRARKDLGFATIERFQ